MNHGQCSNKTRHFRRNGCILQAFVLLSLSTLPHTAYPNPKKQKGDIREVTRLTAHTQTHTDFVHNISGIVVCSMRRPKHARWEGGTTKTKKNSQRNSHVLRSTYHPTSHPYDVCPQHAYTQYTQYTPQNTPSFIFLLANTAQKEGAKGRKELVNSRIALGSYS